jgi:hypothetical protein
MAAINSLMSDQIVDEWGPDPMMQLMPVKLSAGHVFSLEKPA